MDSRKMYEAKEMLCEELDKIVDSRQITKSNLDVIKDLTTSILNLMKICEREEGEYSYGRGGWNASGTYSNGMMNSGRYSGNQSYQGYSDGGNTSGRHYVRGHYSRAEDSSTMLTDRIEEMMQEGNLSQNDKNTLRMAMDIIRR